MPGWTGTLTQRMVTERWHLPTELQREANTSGVSVINSNKSSPHVLKLIPFIYHDISKFETTQKVQSLDSL